MSGLDQKALDDAIRARCTTADVHLMCTWPDCGCKTPEAPMRAAITAYLATRREQGYEEQLVNLSTTISAMSPEELAEATRIARATLIERFGRSGIPETVRRSRTKADP